MSNIRSPEAQQWRRLYYRARWKHIRRWVLAGHPLCQRCEAQGLVTPATEVHHNPPHGGDIERFWSGPFEALCKPCHDGPAKREELGLPARDYSTEIGQGGWPIDPRHPANRRLITEY
jgi:5-methylcytosine-specific restriction protein A